MNINADRLWDSIAELARIGAYTDERSGLVGVNRLALTDADALGRRLVMQWMRDTGMNVRVDAMGNVFGRRSGRDDAVAPVLTGSHIDSVATAGAFDGCLGVLGGIEVVRSLNEAGIVTNRPIEVAFFTEEEGVRFGVDMLGSAVLSGRVPLDVAHALTDRAGVRLGDELVRHGFNGDAQFMTPHAYVECHIEQGPVLAREGCQIGVVSGVQGISWQEVTIEGRAAHAGTTPTELRLDSGLAAARVNLRLREMADSNAFGQMRATVGSMTISPGLTNIVPMRAVFTVDLRNPDDEAMMHAETALAAFLEELQDEGFSCSARRMAKTQHVPFDEDVKSVIARTADGLGLSHREMLSGAGHDAQEMAAVCPTAMIFIPGEYDGISHNPREFSTPEACANGVQVLAATILELAS